jgi:hypothetical protein
MIISHTPSLNILSYCIAIIFVLDLASWDKNKPGESLKADVRNALKDIKKQK